MLKSFEILNFKSFTKPTKFSLEKDKEYEILAENVNSNILKGLLFIGPNASGKTNALNAVTLLVELINKSVDIKRYINFFSENELNAEYKFLFNEDLVNYKIKFNIKTKEVSEKLKINSDIMLNEISTEQTKLKQFLESNLDDKVIEKFYNYLNNSIVIDLYNDRQSSDVNDFKNPKVIYTSEKVKKINEFLTFHNFDYTLKNINEDCSKDKLFFIKKGVNVPLPFEMESIGNKTLIYLLPILNNVIEKGGMILLDEFGSGMHNILEELLIRFFMKNSKNSQIFLVSHSTNLLSQNLLRPDQIISVDYENGSSIIFKFSTEKPRSSQNLEKMYLGGVFGGLPNFNKK